MLILFALYKFLTWGNEHNFGYRLKQAGFAADDLKHFYEGKQVYNQELLISLLKEFDMRPSEIEKFVTAQNRKRTV